MVVIDEKGKLKRGICKNSTNPLNSKKSLQAMIDAITKTSGDIRFLGAGYDNLSNFGLKGIVAAFVIGYAEKEEHIISKYNISKLLMCSLLKKAEGEIKKEVKKDLCDVLHVDKEFFDVAIPHIEFCKAVNVEAANEMFFGAKVTEMEKKIVEFAGVLTTLAELMNIRYKLEDSVYQEKRIEMEIRCQKYSDMPGFEELKDMLRKFAEIGNSLSDQIRWKLQIGGERTPVLRHIAITAILSFFNALEVRDNHEDAGKCFFMGIYHDLPEAWTGDIPSPVKDKDIEEILESYFFRVDEIDSEMVSSTFNQASKITNLAEKAEFLEKKFYEFVGTVPEDVKSIINLIETGTTIRDGVEKVEESTMEKNFYSKLPTTDNFNMKDKIRELMFEDEQNRPEYFKMIKGIDYVGAVLEIYLIYVNGSADKYYLGANDRTKESIDLGKYELGKNIIEVFDDYKLLTEKLLASAYNDDKVKKLEQQVKELLKKFEQK